MSGSGHQDELLTPREAARLLRLSERTLCRYRTLGIGPAWLRAGSRMLRYRRTDVLAWLVAQPGTGR